MSDPDRLLISYVSQHYVDADWTAKADRWTARFYTQADTTIFGTADVTRVIPGLTPNPRRALEADPGLLDRIPRVVFAEDGELSPPVGEMNPKMLLLLESVQVEDKWRGKGVGMTLAIAAMRRMAVPGTVAVCYPAPIHPQHGPGEVCSYESDDPKVRRPDEEAVSALRKAWERHGFRHLIEGVYAMALG